ncbi:MAG TPA: sugar ABC transporter substrate-binding protein, partial [Candidatus Ozemobacteraceae bacterium]|nr:sugar ABC transporter substrate-binding protein [Candidatus Ozemobacteraceae bacterium]
MRTAKTILVRVFFLFSMFACVYPESCIAGQLQPFAIGVLYWSSTIPGQVAMRKGLEAEAELLNAELAASGARPVKLISNVAGDGADGIERQIVQMREFIHQKVDLIIVQPTDNAALSQPLQEANKAGIPVVAYDQYIDDGKIAAYLTTDNYQAGYLDGEYTAESFPDDRMLRVILVEYPNVSSTVERVNGFLDALQNAKQPYKILKAYNAVEPVSGTAAGKEILHDYPGSGSIDVVFTVNDGGGLSVVQELASAGRREIFVATIDGDPASVKNIIDGRLTRI